MSDTPFYVGYLPLPPALRGFVRRAVTVAVLLALAAVVVLAVLQPPSGDGSFADDEVVLEGVLRADPYPNLTAEDPTTHELRAWLLVSEGKLGTFDRAARALAGASSMQVRVHGLPLRRREQRVFELVDGSAAIEVVGAAGVDSESTEELDPIEVTGEIIDPKCWLGAMRPGSGLVHRACAALCIRGGIPPCFVGGPDGEAPRFYVLTDRLGLPCNAAVAELAGVLVRMRAQQVRRGELRFLRVDPTSISLVQGTLGAR